MNDNIINPKSMDRKKRVGYIDVMRGLGIFFVAFGHSIGVLNHPINRAILSFHMPLFFFISGMLFWGKDVKDKKIFPGFLIVFVILMLVEIPVIWFANRYVPFLFGKKKQKKKLAGA